MPTDYEKVYQQQRHALGAPTQDFVTFFETYRHKNADVLDLGCGQGRDALFIARQGHHVVGVDISPTGVNQLMEDAQSEELNVNGVVADLKDYITSDDFDIIILDRTLHMLAGDIRIKLLGRVRDATRHDGYVLIADEPKNMASFKDFFTQEDQQWSIIKDKKNW